ARLGHVCALIVACLYSWRSVEGTLCVCFTVRLFLTQEVFTDDSCFSGLARSADGRARPGGAAGPGGVGPACFCLSAATQLRSLYPGHLRGLDAHQPPHRGGTRHLLLWLNHRLGLPGRTHLRWRRLRHWLCHLLQQWWLLF